MQVAEIISSVVGADVPVRVIGYDGSKAGPDSSELALRINSPRALARLATAPGTLGLARAYVSGEIEVEGDLYELLAAMADLTINDLAPRRPAPARPPHAADLAAPPPAAAPARVPAPARAAALQAARLEGDLAPLRRVQPLLRVGARPVDDLHVRVLPDGVGRRSRRRRRPSTSWWRRSSRSSRACACSTSAAAGAAWSCTPRPSTASRRSASRSRATRPSGRRRRSSAAGLGGLAEVRHCDYRDAPESQFDAISSIGLTEHIGRANLRDYFASLHTRLRPEGRLLNHCITQPRTPAQAQLDPFIARYVFPDGQLEPVGLIISRDERRRASRCATRRTCASTTRSPCTRGAATSRSTGTRRSPRSASGRARVWRLYMAACALGFERDNIQLHQVLGVRLTGHGGSGFPLRGWR